MQRKPCVYFRDAVLPLAIRGGNSKAAEKYAEIDHRAVMEDEATRKCACGAALPPRKRLCPKCALQNKRKTHRENWHRQRGIIAGLQTGQLTENGNFNPLSRKEL
ncbi:MAG: hypothetical protein V1918_04795 [Planctomycetota bacterium]